MTTGHSHVFSEDEEKSGFRTIWYKKNFEHPVNYLGEKLRDVMDEANAGGYPSPKPKATPKPKPEHVESPLINGKPGTRKNLGFKDLTTLGAEVDRWGLSILFYNDIENDQDLSIKLYFEVASWNEEFGDILLKAEVVQESEPYVLVRDINGLVRHVVSQFLSADTMKLTHVENEDKSWKFDDEGVFWIDVFFVVDYNPREVFEGPAA